MKKEKAGIMEQSKNEMGESKGGERTVKNIRAVKT